MKSESSYIIFIIIILKILFIVHYKHLHIQESYFCISQRGGWFSSCTYKRKTILRSCRNNHKD